MGGWIIIVLSILMIAMYIIGIPYIVLETVLFSIITVEGVRFINIKNRLFNFIGRESLSFYLYQMLFLFIGLEIGLSKKWLLYGSFVFVTTFLLSYVYSLLVRYVDKNKFRILC